MRHAAPASGRILVGRRQAGRRRTAAGQLRPAGRVAQDPQWPSASERPADLDESSASSAANRTDAQRRGVADDSSSVPLRRSGQLRFAQLPYLLVLAGTAAALLTIRQGIRQVRGGTLVFAGVLLAAALARLILPEHRAGMLSSRQRLLDVAILAALGICLLIGALVLPAPG